MPSDPADRLRQIAVGFQQAKILLTAAELRVFDHLRSGATVADVSALLGGDARAVEILLDALVAMGILAKQDGRYRNVPHMEPFLVEDGPTHTVAWLRHLNRLFRNWAFLEERVRGEKVPDVATRELAADHENFIRAMYAVSHLQVEDVVARIGLAGVKTVADLGGGPGHYLAAFLRRAPHADGYLVDFSSTLEIAARVQSDNPDWSRVHSVEWDLYGQDPPASLPPIDLAFLSQLVHSEPAQENAGFFKRLFRVISPGGRVVVHDQVLEPDRTAPLAAAVFAVNMLAMTPGGRTYTEREIAAWGTEGGFVFERGERLSERSYLVFLGKPSA